MTQLDSLLLVEPDSDYIAMLMRDPAFARLSPRITPRGEDARAVLTKSNSAFRAIVVSASVTDPGAVSVIRTAHEYHPATPVFMLYDGEAPLSSQEMMRLALRGCIPRPLSFTELWQKTTLPFSIPPEDTFSGVAPAVVLENSPHTNSGVPLESDTEFRPVRIEQFLTGYPSLYDIYIRVPTGKYLKILNAKDVLDPKRARHYITLGVDRLFIRRSSHDRLLSYCDLLASALIRRTSGVSIELKFSQLASHGAEIARTIHRVAEETGEKTALSDVHVDFALSYLADLFSLVRQLEKAPNPLVQRFLRSGALMETGVAASMIAGLMAIPLGLGTDRSFVQLGMAALLHDIGILMLPKHIQGTPTDLLREEELRIYQTHPELGANALRPNSKRIGPTTLQAISQHHMRRDGTGFPQKVGVTEIHLFAEVIGLADEFLLLLQERRRNPRFDIAGTLELKTFKGFSPKAVDAFRAIFLPNTVRRARTSPGTPV